MQFNDQYPTKEELEAKYAREQAQEANERSKRIERLLEEQNRLLREAKHDK